MVCLLLTNTQNAKIICSTCIGAGDERLKDFRFDFVLIDEATQASEPTTLVPLLKGCSQAVLVGDHKQLGPTVLCKAASYAGLSVSLYERFLSNGMTLLQILKQYRMNPHIASFPSKQFYLNELHHGVSIVARTNRKLNIPWSNRRMPMMFLSISGKEKLGKDGTSSLNPMVADKCVEIVNMLLSTGVKAQDVGIITLYDPQRRYIINLIASIDESIEVKTVSGFQGREKDYIILCCLHSNSQNKLSYTAENRRINVAVTRARFGLFIIGNHEVLGAQRGPWRNLVNFYKERKCLVQGPLDALERID